MLWPLMSCAAAPVPVVVHDAVPAELMAPTPAPVVPATVTASTPGILLIQYDDALGSCNLDKHAISAWQAVLMKKVTK